MIRRALAISIFAFACSGETDDDRVPPPNDAGMNMPDANVVTDAGFAHEITPAAPMPPAAPNEPVLTPCPAGWRTVVRADAPDVCDPWPASGRQTCPPGEAHFPGTPGCARIGPACPSGEFADMGPNAVYVTASTTAAGGDGSMSAPFTSIQQAINAAPRGGFVVLGRGSFEQLVTVDRDVVLMGSCVADTRISSSLEVLEEGVITVTADAELMGFTVGGARIGILVTGGRIMAHDFAVVGAREVGFRVVGGEAIIENAIIRDTTAASGADLGYGHGMGARDGGRFEVSRAVVENNREIGIALRNAVATPHRFSDIAIVGTQLQAPFDTGRALNVSTEASAIFERAAVEDSREVGIALSYSASLELYDVVIRNTRGNSVDLFGTGMAVNANSHAEGARIWVTNSANTGIAVGSDPDEQANVDFTDLVIEDTNGDVNGDFGRGFEVGFGADARLERIWLRNNRLHGLFVDNPGSSITATDAFSLETRPKAADGTSGWGASATREASLFLHRALLARNSNTGASFSTNSQVVLRDVVVEHTAPGATGVVGPCGRGLNIQDGASLDAERVRISHNREVGIISHDPTTFVTLTDIVVEDTATVGFNQFGSGIGLQGGSHQEIERAVVSESRESGVFVHDGSTLQMTDVLIENGIGTLRFGTFGRGVNVQNGGILEGERILIQDNREAGIVVASPGSSATLTDVTIRRTLQRLCAPTTCPDEGAGSGVVVRASASAVLERFLLDSNFVIGAQISTGATIDLTEGDVVMHPVGVNVQTMGFDNARVLNNNVRYVDNDVPVNGDSLFVPSNDISAVPQ